MGCLVDVHVNRIIVCPGGGGACRQPTRWPGWRLIAWRTTKRTIVLFQII